MFFIFYVLLFLSVPSNVHAKEKGRFVFKEVWTSVTSKKIFTNENETICEGGKWKET